MRIALICLLALPLHAGDVVVNGFKMHYEERGQGEPVLLLHGFSLDARTWEPQSPLAKKYRLIMPDSRFHGRSEIPANSVGGSAEAAADMVALLDHLKIGRAHVVGHSMGGTFGLELALRYPDRVRSLILVAPGIEGAPTPPEAMSRFMEGLKRYQSEGIAGWRASWLSDPLFAQANVKPELRRQVAAMVEAFQFEALMKVRLPPTAKPTQLERLEQVKTPTLVLIGTEDQPHVRSASETTAKKIPGANIIIYSGTGHMLSMEQPKKFNRDVEQFLKQVATH